MRAPWFLVALLAGGCHAALPEEPALPEAASGYRTGLSPVLAKTFMVSTSNPLASQAGYDILKAGGSAADAAVAVQAVLGLTVPEATGLGGGAFMLYYDAAAGTVQAYDGRETAPAAATENDLRWIDAGQRTAPLPNRRASGRSIGTIGAVRMIELAQRDHGRMPWKDLFGSATRLAEEGFPIGGRLAAAIASNAGNLKRDAEAAAYFLEADGSPKAQGTVLKNPAYAATLRAVAGQGADALYTGPIARDIVAKIATTEGADGSPITPGKTTLDDLSGFRARRLEPVCATYRAYWICGAPPPSSGGIAVAETLGVLESFDMAAQRPTAIDREGGKPTVDGVHLVAEAERLAYADRDRYVADTGFVPLPGGSWAAMLDKGYLRRRAALIRLDKSMGVAPAGVLDAAPHGVDGTVEHGTNHFTIIDSRGDVATMTSTVESSMGSFHLTHGFILNNQLTDFSATPVDRDGLPIANRLQPGKRPRSTMAPTLVFRIAPDGGRGDFVLATGSPGGGTIAQYVVKTLVGMLDWGLDAQQSAGLVDFGARNSPVTTVGGEHPLVDTRDGGAHDPLVTGLRARGHEVSMAPQSSGVGTIARTTVGGVPAWAGGTDPRREGVVLGDTFAP